ncbi:MAG: threonine synthase [Chloroflexota bacterium]
MTAPPSAGGARYSYLIDARCSRCSLSWDAFSAVHLCSCGGPLLARYDTAAAADALSRGQIAARPADLWRYHELLPVQDQRQVVSLGEGMTPLVPCRRLGQRIDLPNLSVKDESLNPSSSFKARGAAVGVSRAAELGVTVAIMPTAGNAGGAWAAYAARAGLRLVAYMPADAPPMCAVEAKVYGADAYAFEGLITDAGGYVAAQLAANDWYDCTTLKEPYRVEGKKTIGFEIAEQLAWDLPDAILMPTGGGVGTIGIFKALLEMEEMGWIHRPFPRLIAVQSAGCAPLVKAWQEGAEECDLWPAAHTIAGGLRVPKALGDFLVLRAIRETDGMAVSVTDDEMCDSLKLLAREEGLFACLEGAAAVAAAGKLRAGGHLAAKDRVVVVNTASGLKSPNLFDSKLPMADVARSRKSAQDRD